MDSYFQKATIVRLRADGPAQLSVNGKPIAAVPTVFTAPGNPVSGKVAVARSADAKALPQGEVVLVGAADAEPQARYRAAIPKKIQLLILRERDESGDLYTQLGGSEGRRAGKEVVIAWRSLWAP